MVTLGTVPKFRVIRWPLAVAIQMTTIDGSGMGD